MVLDGFGRVWEGLGGVGRGGEGWGASYNPPLHLTILTGGWWGVVCSCPGVNRINVYIVFDDFYILFRPINRKTCENIYKKQAKTRSL